MSDTEDLLLVTLLVLAGISLPLALLTALGAKKRGHAMPIALLTGFFYPVTWTVWYVKDEHPYRRGPRHAI